MVLSTWIIINNTWISTDIKLQQRNTSSFYSVSQSSFFLAEYFYVSSISPAHLMIFSLWTASSAWYHRRDIDAVFWSEFQIYLNVAHTSYNQRDDEIQTVLPAYFSSSSDSLHQFHAPAYAVCWMQIQGSFHHSPFVCSVCYCHHVLSGFARRNGSGLFSIPTCLLKHHHDYRRMNFCMTKTELYVICCGICVLH